MNELEVTSKQHSTLLKSDESKMHQISSSVARLNNVTKQKSILNQQGTDVCHAKTEDSIDAQERLNSFEESDIKIHHEHRRQNMKRKIHLHHLDNDGSPTALNVQNEINGATVVKRSPIASKLLCFNDIGNVKDTKTDQTHFSHLGSRDEESVHDSCSTEETQLNDTDIDKDGSGDDRTQQLSQIQAVRHSSTTTTQTTPEDTNLQNRRQDVFPDPAVDDTDIQRFEPMMAIIDKIAVGERLAPQITMRYEMLRLRTLRSFPKENKPFIIRIAQAGFYYAKSGDEVVCYCCAKRMSGWLETDVPLEVHRLLSPNCRFLISNLEVNVSVRRQETLASRLPASAAAAAEVTKSKTIPNITMVSAPLLPSTLPQPCSTPIGSMTTTINAMKNTSARDSSRANLVKTAKYPAYETLVTRQVSFKGCSEVSVPADSLTEAGFFYVGFSDCCRCFQCGVGLRNWSEEDDPWIEHARWSKNCSYVREKKGDEFINLVQMAVEYQQNQQQIEEQQLQSQTTVSKSGSEIFLDDLRAVGKRCADLDLKKFKASVAGISLDAQDLDSLKNNGWLTDKIIDAYLMFLQKRCEDKQLHVFVLQTFVGSSWNKGQFGLHLYEQAKLTDCKWVFVPMHVNGNHWVLLVAHMPTKTVTVYDSLHKDNTKCFNFWKKFMSERARHVPHDSPEGWTLGRNLSSSQGDGDSCGAFVLLNALATVNGIATEELNHDHADAMRTYVFWTLIEASNALREE